VDHYNSDSFVSVPLVHRNRLLGVLNLSNKRDGKAFDETDLDRAMMASAVLSLAMGVREAENEGASVAVPVALADDTVNTDPPVIPAKSAPESLTPMSSERPQDYPFEMRG
jgi:signal transduction protein with GAF and PtsI domain